MRDALKTSRRSTAELARLAHEARQAIASTDGDGSAKESPAFRIVAIEAGSAPEPPEPKPSAFELVVSGPDGSTRRFSAPDANLGRHFEESVARLGELEAAASQAVQDKLELQLEESIRLRLALQAGQDESKNSTRTLNRLTLVLVALTALAAVGAVPVMIDGLRSIGVLR